MTDDRLPDTPETADGGPGDAPAPAPPEPSDAEQQATGQPKPAPTRTASAAQHPVGPADPSDSPAPGGAHESANSRSVAAPGDARGFPTSQPAGEASARTASPVSGAGNAGHPPTARYPHPVPFPAPHLTAPHLTAPHPHLPHAAQRYAARPPGGLPPGPPAGWPPPWHLPSPRVRRARRLTLLTTAAVVVLALIGTTLYVILRPTSSPNAAPPDAATATASPAPSHPNSAVAGTDPALAAFYTQRLTWHSCGQHEQCANVTVPLDYAHPTGPTLKLAMVRIPATDPSRRIGSLLVNPGGPGGSAIEYVESGMAATPTIQARYDLIGLDPRGVGQSSPLRCVSDQQLDTIVNAPPAPQTPQDIQAAVNAALTLAQGCEATSGNVLPYVGTENAARDMDIVRALLGETKLDYRGESYGTYLGAVYAGLFPQRVGHFVLDGAVDPALTGRQGDLSQARGFETAITAFVTDCLHQPDCPVGPDVPSALREIRAFLNGLSTKPLPGDGTRMLTAAQGTTAVIATLYADETWPLLRSALGQAMQQGQGAALLRIADLENERSPGGHYTSNLIQANAAINCADRGDDTSVAEIQADLPAFEQASPTFGDVLDWGGLICSVWPVKPQIAPGPINAAGAPPILVVGTLRDPATPYEEAQHLAAELPNATLLTWDGDGHTAYLRGSTCVDNAVDTFIITGTMPAKNTICPSRAASSSI